MDFVASDADPDLLEIIVRAAGDVRPQALLDSVGGPLVQRLMGTLAPGARILAYGVQDPAPAAITNAMLVYSHLTWKGFGIDRWLSEIGDDVRSGMRAELWTMARTEPYKFPIVSQHPLDSIEDALIADERRTRSNVIGKTLLV